MKTTRKQSKSKPSKPPRVKLPPLRWATTGMDGKRTIHTMPNPIEGIVNKFNDYYSEYGMTAEVA